MRMRSMFAWLSGVMLAGNRRVNPNFDLERKGGRLVKKQKPQRGRGLTVGKNSHYKLSARGDCLVRHYPKTAATKKARIRLRRATITIQKTEPKTS